MQLQDNPVSGSRRRRIVVAAVGAVVLAGGLGVQAAFASHPEVSLPGSTFEIDTDANLKVDDTGSLDWMNVTQIQKADLPPGAGDDSFGQGTKEDTAVPTVVNGSIPPNKSDLTNFGLYLETTATGAHFLNLYWTRVQDPTGTTNMDFEFNQSTVLSSNGVTPVRTAGDVLIQYDLANGGTHPELFVSRWVATGSGSLCQANNSTPCWGTRTNLTAAGDATGSINTTAIPNAEDDGLSETGFSARTFGEAQLDFDALTSGLGGCVSFGSAYLKSRSSDSFTAALKDFIAPVSTNFARCGAITITKAGKNVAAGSGDQPLDATFSITGPNSYSNTVSTGSDGTVCVGSLALGDYTVTETVAPTGYKIDDASGHTVTVDNAANCSDNPYGGESVAFTDTPLTDISVNATSQAPGATNSTITCVDSSNAVVADSGALADPADASAADLEPGVYTCTITIDP